MGWNTPHGSAMLATIWTGLPFSDLETGEWMMTGASLSPGQLAPAAGGGIAEGGAAAGGGARPGSFFTAGFFFFVDFFFAGALVVLVDFAGCFFTGVGGAVVPVDPGGCGVPASSCASSYACAADASHKRLAAAAARNWLRCIPSPREALARTYLRGCDPSTSEKNYRTSRRRWRSAGRSRRTCARRPGSMRPIAIPSLQAPASATTSPQGSTI